MGDVSPVRRTKSSAGTARTLCGKGPAQAKRRKQSEPAARVCDACGALNESRAPECAKCGSKRFAPTWIRHLRRVTKNFAVQVADAHPLAASTDQRLVLYKWWPGGRSTFNINTSNQWEAVKAIIDTDLAQYLGWRTVAAIKQDITARQGEAAALDRQVRELGSEDPQLLAEILRGLELDKASGGSPSGGRT
jgi:ribosomal protein L40E